MKIVVSMGPLIALGLCFSSATAQTGSDAPSASFATSTVSTSELFAAPSATPSSGPATGGSAQQPVPPGYRPVAPITFTSTQGSTYVPLDNWVYPALDRLHALGYIDTAFLGLRPWTRLSIVSMLQETSDKLDAHPGDQEALEIFLALRKEFAGDEEGNNGQRVVRTDFDSVYTDLRGISGTPLRDSYHLGQTIVNDYGRPYQEGFNNYSGFSARGQAGRFTLYFRGEYQHAPGATGYSLALAQQLSALDSISYSISPVQATIPQGPIPDANPFRVMEANLSYHLLGHEVSFGKNDHWLSPAKGGAMSWSNNAENIYAFEINRVEPLRIPGISRITGPFRYDFFVGSLKGHTAPNDPWVHMEKVSLKPTKNLELGFQRTIIWGGKDHEPVNIHTFLRSFFSVTAVSAAQKFSPEDPGARFSSFDFNYRLPFVRNWLSLYSDSEAHDEVNPISAPRRSAVRPGLYLSRFPLLTHLDLRVEGASTSPVSNAGAYGNFLYWEAVQRQGTTNKGFLFSDWIGRDSKGGQAWLTYHLSPSENIQFMYRNAKADQKFIPGGTTQNVFEISAVKRVMKDIEIRGWVQHEDWKAPIYKPGQQSDTMAAAQITWFPKESKKF